MAHYSRLSRIVVDAPEATHAAEIAFWQGATGRPLQHYERFPAFHGTELSADGFGLLTQRLEEGAARVHLDIHTTDLAAEVARLTALGATMVTEGEHWSIMRDPAGLVFCVVPDSTLTEANAQRWD